MSSVSQAGTELLGSDRVLAIVVVAAVYIGVLVRFGMFPLMMTFLTNFIVMQGGLTADLDKLYAPTGLWLMALIAAIAAFGFYASRAGEPLFGKLGNVRRETRNGHASPFHVFRFVVRAVGVAVHGSSGHGCLGYRPRSSFRTSAYVVFQKLRRSRVVCTGRPFGASSASRTGSLRGPILGVSARPNSSCSFTDADTVPSSSYSRRARSAARHGD